MNIDFIKWLCDKAEGYAVGVMNIVLSVDEQEAICDIEELKEEKPVHYRDILQRAIEGVNKEYTVDEANNYCIYIMNDDIEVGFDMYTRQHNFIDKFDSIDQAKESALKYIYEQETK